MKKFAMLAALAVLAVPAGASAQSNGSDCSYTTTGGADIGVQAGSGGLTGSSNVTAVGACLNTGSGAFQGGSVEAGVGEDQSTAADPEIVPGVLGPDAYLVVDGDNENTVHDQADGYVGLSNWETGSTRDPSCNNSDNGAAGSSNSGGCVSTDVPGVAVALPASIPTPVCGNTSGNSFNGTGSSTGSSQRDGCQVP